MQLYQQLSPLWSTCTKPALLVKAAFTVYLRLQLQLLLDELCPSGTVLLHWPEQLNCVGRSPCSERGLGQMKVPQAFSSISVWSYYQSHIMGQSTLIIF